MKAPPICLSKSITILELFQHDPQIVYGPLFNFFELFVVYTELFLYILIVPFASIAKDSKDLLIVR